MFFRLERVKIKEIRSQAKIIGTVVTFSGTLLMTLYKGPVVDLFMSSKSNHHGSSSGDDDTGKHWLTGTLFILIACVAWSSFYVLQVSILINLWNLFYYMYMCVIKQIYTCNIIKLKCVCVWTVDGVEEIPGGAVSVGVDMLDGDGAKCSTSTSCRAPCQCLETWLGL